MTITKSRCHRIVVLSWAALGAACSSSSGGGDSPADENSFGAKYKLADNEISGWSQKTTADAFLAYTADSLTIRIDGAAVPYTDRGMRFALVQELVGPDPQNATFWAMDMTTEANAQSMVEHQKTTQSATLTIPPYDASVAIASETLTGITVYAYFKSLYLEVILDGYGSDQDTARQVGAKFLETEKAKTK
jgi:hypothetical protein